MAYDSFGNAGSKDPLVMPRRAWLPITLRSACYSFAALTTSKDDPWDERECVGVSLQVSAEIRHETGRIPAGSDSKLVRGDRRLGVRANAGGR